MYRRLQVFEFPAALGATPEPRGRAPGPLESAARWHRALAFPRQLAQLSLNEFLLSSLWADPTQQQFCNTCCSHIYHLNPQITFGNFLENCQPFFPIGISSQELSHNCRLEGSSGGHLAWPLTPAGKRPALDEVSYRFVQSTLWGLRSFSRLHSLSSFHCYANFVQGFLDLNFWYPPLKCLTPLITSSWDLNGPWLASFKTAHLRSHAP